MKYSELKRWLEKQGCYRKSEGSNHEEWINNETGQTTRIGRHGKQDIGKGILHKMLKDLGLKM